MSFQHFMPLKRHKVQLCRMLLHILESLTDSVLEIRPFICINHKVDTCGAECRCMNLQLHPGSGKYNHTHRDAIILHEACVRYVLHYMDVGESYTPDTIRYERQSVSVTVKVQVGDVQVKR